MFNPFLKNLKKPLKYMEQGVVLKFVVNNNNMKQAQTYLSIGQLSAKVPSFLEEKD